jgi:hypothetical protein
VLLGLMVGFSALEYRTLKYLLCALSGIGGEKVDD